MWACWCLLNGLLPLKLCSFGLGVVDGVSSIYHSIIAVEYYELLYSQSDDRVNGFIFDLVYAAAKGLDMCKSCVGAR